MSVVAAKAITGAFCKSIHRQSRMFKAFLIFSFTLIIVSSLGNFRKRNFLLIAVMVDQQLTGHLRGLLGWG